jgi:pyrimidine oxygenase
MDVGVFLPTGRRGWIISDESPTGEVTYDLNRRVVEVCEEAGMEFALSMVKFRGFGGPSGFWDQALESFTLVAALAATTERIKFFPSIGALALPPVVAAQMTLTLESIAPGRIGVNMVSGWQKAEYAQMGLWPGEEHYTRRYDYCTEYVEIMRRLWQDGTIDSFQGDFFQFENVKLAGIPPEKSFDIVCAGQSDRGMQFAAECGRYNFTLGKGENTPKAFAPQNDRLAEWSEKTGREVTAIPVFTVIADETEAAARKTFKHYVDTADFEAIRWITGQADLNKNMTAESSLADRGLPDSAVNMNRTLLIGSYEQVAEMLDEVAEVPQTSGVMLAFDDSVRGAEWFRDRVQPLMASRRDRVAA